ncbi:hypothetical protein S40288_10172 [Stachybotrys chartarum IBT 40288]|nr:hypothetical protein S40288_10172 [Stachybotrys chartarum IBT 40288]
MPKYGGHASGDQTRHACGPDRDRTCIEVGVPDPFNQVNEWSNYMREAAARFVEIGSLIGVDEGIVGFKGQSRHKITIKTKPTPTGLKVWILAANGYPNTAHPNLRRKEDVLPQDTAEAIWAASYVNELLKVASELDRSLDHVILREPTGTVIEDHIKGAGVIDDLD